MGTLVRYWPWWVTIAWLLGYELFAVASGRATLSQLVWRGQARSAALVWVAVPLVTLLMLHFFAGLWR